MKEDSIDRLVNQFEKLTTEIRDLKTSAKFVYTNAELMNLLSVSTATVKKWRDAGLLGYSHVGDTYLYKKEDVEEFLLAIHYNSSTQNKKRR